MTSVVWRAAGVGFDVDLFLRRFPSLHPDAEWRRGTKKVLRGLHSDSGISVGIGDFEIGDNPNIGWRAFLSSHRSELSAARAMGADNTLDFGVMVGHSSSYSRRLEFDASTVNELAQHGVGIAFSAYPCSDPD